MAIGWVGPSRYILLDVYVSQEMYELIIAMVAEGHFHSFHHYECSQTGICAFSIQYVPHPPQTRCLGHPAWKLATVLRIWTRRSQTNLPFDANLWNFKALLILGICLNDRAATTLNAAKAFISLKDISGPNCISTWQSSKGEASDKDLGWKLGLPRHRRRLRSQTHHLHHRPHPAADCSATED